MKLNLVRTVIFRKENSAQTTTYLILIKITPTYARLYLIFQTCETQQSNSTSVLPEAIRQFIKISSRSPTLIPFENNIDHVILFFDHRSFHHDRLQKFR